MSAFDRLFASTAIALLLALSASGTFAASDSASGSDAAASPAQDSQADKAAQPAAAGSAQNAPTTDAEPPVAPSNATTPAAATPSVAGEAKPDATPGAATASPNEPAPAKSAAEAKPAEKPADNATERPADNAADKPTDKPATTATAPATASPEGAAPATAVAAGPDAAITEQLRELANGKFDRVLGSKKDRTQIDTFYSGRNYAPLWITDGKINARATAAADYLVPSFAALSAPADLADAEIKLTSAVATYAHHASVGRVHWSRVSADIEFSTPAAEPSDVLAAVAGASDVAATLDSYEPQNSGYRALKAKLADIRAGKIDKEKAPIGKGAVLKIGMEDDRVPALRERLHVSGASGATYDKPLAEAVKKFQQQHDLAATGTLTAATVEALNGRQPDRVTDIILAN